MVEVDPPLHEWSQGTAAVRNSNETFGSGKTKVLDVQTTRQIPGGGGELLANETRIVQPQDAERIVMSLRAIPLDEIGSSSFLRMYGHDLERLALQAHSSAALSHDEYVVEYLLLHNKIITLVETLLAVEGWRVHVLPHLEKSLADHGNVLRTVFMLHVETTILGLLNLVLYRREAIIQGFESDNEGLVALVDYCARAMVSLATPTLQSPMLKRQKEPMINGLSDHLMHRSRLVELRESVLDAMYQTFVSAVSTARYLCEYFDDISLSVRHRVLETHDYLTLLIPLVEEPPWTRRRRRESSSSSSSLTNTWEKWIDNKWETVPNAELMMVTKCEAQCWIALYNLTCCAESRKQYGLNSFRKEQLLRLRKYLTNVMLDQLPILADLRRYLDELTLLNVPSNHAAASTSNNDGSGVVLLEQVSRLHDSIVGCHKKKWEDVALMQFETIFGKITDSQDEDLKMISDVYSADNGVADLMDVGHNHQTSQQQQQQNPQMLPVIEPTAVKIAKITLTVGDDSDQVFEFSVEDGNGKISKMGESGLYRRLKLSPFSSCDDHTNKLVVVQPKAGAVAKITFENHERMLSIDSFDLPLVIENFDDATEKEDKRTPKKVWRQIGSLKEKLVLQLGFLPHHNEINNTTISYRITNFFVSQPATFQDEQ